MKGGKMRDGNAERSLSEIGDACSIIVLLFFLAVLPDAMSAASAHICASSFIDASAAAIAASKGIKRYLSPDMPYRSRCFSGLCIYI